MIRHKRWLVPALTALVLLAAAAPAFTEDPDPVAMINDTHKALKGAKAGAVVPAVGD